MPPSPLRLVERMAAMDPLIRVSPESMMMQCPVVATIVNRTPGFQCRRCCWLTWGEAGELSPPSNSILNPVTSLDQCIRPFLYPKACCSLTWDMGSSLRRSQTHGAVALQVACAQRHNTKNASINPPARWSVAVSRPACLASFLLV